MYREENQCRNALFCFKYIRQLDDIPTQKNKKKRLRSIYIDKFEVFMPRSDASTVQMGLCLVHLHCLCCMLSEQHKVECWYSIYLCLLSAMQCCCSRSNGANLNYMYMDSAFKIIKHLKYNRSILFNWMSFIDNFRL